MARSQAATVEEYLEELPDDLPLDVIGQVIARTPPEKYIAIYEASRRR